MSKIQVFVSFDIEHDGELYEELLAQSATPTSGFTVVGGSERVARADVGCERMRCPIREADQVIVICGAHTGASTSVSAELRIAQEERTPYILLWGRRDIMCTKPTGAKPAEGMYSWTQRILADQISRTSRRASDDTKATALRGATQSASPR